MKLTIAAVLCASAAAFAPSAPVVSRVASTSLGWTVHVYNEEEEIDATFDCEEGTYIVDAAEEAGVDLPYSCRAGACSTCVGKIEGGEVNQEEQSFLDEDQMEEGWALTCVAFPTADCEIKVHMEEDLFG